MATSEQKKVKASEVESASNKEKKGAMIHGAEEEQQQQQEEEEEEEAAGGGNKGPPARSASCKSTWPGFADPESKRKRRVASYKVYNVERKLKTSLTHSFRWLKSKYVHMTYTW